MLNWRKNNTLEAEPVEVNADIRVIGDRSAGKTAYMAAIAYWPNASPNSPVESVTSSGNLETSTQLINMAQNILEQGLELEPTRLDAKVDEVKDYGLNILLKERNGKLRLKVNCKDYAGEFFSDLIHKTGDPLLADYLEDCRLAKGILLLVDGTSHRKDSEYAVGLEKFLIALNPAQKQRIAFTVNKCELSQLWVSRHEPRELVNRRFPKMQQKLEHWAANRGCQVNYFMTSAFGVLGTDNPEPNTITRKRDRNGTASVIQKPKSWRPFGLVSPIYWLCTGLQHKTLSS